MIETKLVTLGQNFRFGYYDVPAKERLFAIKQAGFQDIMIHWDENKFVHQDGSPDEIYDEAVKIGLDVKTCHFPQEVSNDVWIDGEVADSYANLLTDCIEKMGQRGVSNLVIHTSKGTNPPPYNIKGIDRLKRCVEAAEKHAVNLAFENVRLLEYNSFVYDNIDSQRVKLCYDVGHENCFTSGSDVLDMYGDRLCTTHLSDNFGPERGDLHLPLLLGSIDLKTKIKRLLELNSTSFNLETYKASFGKCADMNLEEYLSYSYNTLHSLIFD